MRVCVYGGDDGRLRLTEISWTRLAGFFLLPDRFVGLCLRQPCMRERECVVEREQKEDGGQQATVRSLDIIVLLFLDNDLTVSAVAKKKIARLMSFVPKLMQPSFTDLRLRAVLNIVYDYFRRICICSHLLIVTNLVN